MTVVPNLRCYLTMPILVVAILASIMGHAAKAADMIVNADTSLEWNQKEGFYQALGNAHAYQGEQEIFADDLKAFYDASASARDITEIHANGNVRFADAAHTGSGSSLIYQSGTGAYRLIGPNARIDGPDGKATAKKEIEFLKKTIERQASEIIKLQKKLDEATNCSEESVENTKKKTRLEG